MGKKVLWIGYVIAGLFLYGCNSGKNKDTTNKN